jgi:hypothetical protein
MTGKFMCYTTDVDSPEIIAKAKADGMLVHIQWMDVPDGFDELGHVYVADQDTVRNYHRAGGTWGYND